MDAYHVLNVSLRSHTLESTTKVLSGDPVRRSGFNELILTEFKSITRVLAMVMGVQVKRRIHVTDEESERSEDDSKRSARGFSSSSNVLVQDACFHAEGNCKTKGWRHRPVPWISGWPDIRRIRRSQQGGCNGPMRRRRTMGWMIPKRAELSRRDGKNPGPDKKSTR